MRSDVCKSRSSASDPGSAPEWSWALSEVCEIPEALRPTHDSQVG